MSGFIPPFKAAAAVFFDESAVAAAAAAAASPAATHCGLEILLSLVRRQSPSPIGLCCYMQGHSFAAATVG